MARSLNKVTLIGNVGKEPELRYTPNGTAVANFSIATSERFKTQDGEWKEQTEWHNVVAWRKLAEIVGEYVKKGSKLYVEGKIKTRSWDDKEGKKNYRTEVFVDNMIMLDSKGSQGGGGGFGGGDSATGFEPDQITDDDIPF